MYFFSKSSLKLLPLCLMLITGNAWFSTARSLPNQRLYDETAAAFLAETGILSQIQEDFLPQESPLLSLTEYHASDYAEGDSFGYSVAIDGHTVIIGARNADVGDNVDQGAAYIFIRNGSTWIQQQKLVAADGAAGDYFGFSVALSDDTALVGTWADVGDNMDQGAAYVFTCNDSIWSQQQKLVANDGDDHDFFGSSVAIDKDTILIGAEYADVDSNSVQGAAYVFARHENTWSQQQKLVADDGAAGDYFGDSVALDDNTALVGAYNANVSGTVGQGAAYIFVRSDLTWSQQQKLVATDGAEVDFFGISVALDGNTALVGAYKANVDSNSDQGAAYVFTRSGSTWSQQQKLIATDGNIEDSFGDSVALNDNTALVGAYKANVGSNSDQGAVYIFIHNGLTWSQQQKLVVADGGEKDHFGAVALNGITALVGASGANVDGVEKAGKFYIAEGTNRIFLPMVTR